MTQTQVSQLYVSLLGRASEKEGNDFWQAAHATQLAGAEAMLGLQIVADYFGGTSVLNSSAGFVEHIYLSTLNKNRDGSNGATADEAGINYWIGRLDGTIEGQSQMTKAEMIVTFIEIAEASNIPAGVQFSNRVAVSNEAADKVATAPADFATSMAFNNSGTTGLVVTDDTATKDAAIASFTAGDTLTLTTATDTITGTASDDTINGVVSTLSSEKTLTPADVIDGGAGNDTLNVDLKTNFTGFTGDGSLKNVENVVLTNGSTVDRTFDTSAVTDVTKYTIDATLADVALTDLVAAGVTVDYSGAKAQAINVAFDTAFVSAAGTTDEMTFNVNGLGSAAVDATSTAAAVAQVNVTSTMANIETLNINTHTAQSFMDLSGVAAAKTVNVTGDQALTIADVASTVTKVDASTATGSIDTTLTNSGSLTEVKTGSADDKVTINTANILANATIDGAAGTDTLVVNGAAKTLQLTMSNVETVTTNAGMTGDVIMSNTNTSGIQTINVGSVKDTGSAATKQLTMVNLGASDITVNSDGTQSLATTGLSIDNSGKTTVNLNPLTSNVTAKTATTNDLDITASKTTDLTVNVDAYSNSSSVITAASATNATLNVASGKTSASTPVEVTEFDGTLDVAKATTLTVNATGNLGVTAGATITAGSATSATINTTTASNVLALDAAKLETLTVTAAKDLAFTGSTLTGVQVLTADTGDALSVTALDEAANITVSGTKSTSDATFSTIGTATLDHSIALSATGLAGNLTTGTITAGTGANISLDITKTTGAVTTGAITTGGTITVEADGSTGALGLDGTIDADTVVINAKSALGVLDNSGGALAITAGKSVTLNGTELNANAATITTDTAGAFTAVLNGGIGIDTYTINAGAVAQTAITVTGALGLGTDVFAVNGAASTAAVTIDISGVTDYDAAAINISFAGSKFVGGAGVDTVTGSTGGNTITAGGGADIVSLGSNGAADTIVVADGDTGITVATADAYTNFTTAEDTLKLGTAGSATNFSTLNGSDNAGAATAFAAALTAANATMDGTKIYVNVSDGATAAQSWLFEDTNADGNADQVIILTGVASTGIAATDIVA